MPTPTETWQDRRGMFQRGKDVHQPGRKLSNQFGDPLAGRRTSIGSTGSGVGLEKTDSIEEPGAQRRRVSYACVHLSWCYCVALSGDRLERDACSCSCRRCRCRFAFALKFKVVALPPTPAQTNPRSFHTVLSSQPLPLRKPRHPQARQPRLHRAPRQLHRDGGKLAGPRLGLVQQDFQGDGETRQHQQQRGGHGERWQDDESCGTEEGGGEEGGYGVV
jgi:hypothetical protein